METLTGRLTANAKVSKTSNDRQVVNFSIAINDRYKAKSGALKTITRFVNCAYWAGTGIAPYLNTGTLVELAGRIDAQAWTDAQGKAKATLRFTVIQIKLHGNPKTTGSTMNQQPAPQTPATAGEDLPF